MKPCICTKPHVVYRCYDAAIDAIPADDATKARGALIVEDDAWRTEAAA